LDRTLLGLLTIMRRKIIKKWVKNKYYF